MHLLQVYCVFTQPDDLLLCSCDQAVNESCYQGDDSVLKSLVEIADTAPKYLRPNLETTLQLCLKVCSDVG